jgi:putative ABC transport system permease protein
MILNPFVWKMAWRESRSSIGKLMLFVASIILGVAALVSITSFGDNLDKAIDSQAKTLLGADLEIDGRMEFPEELIALFDSIGGEQAREVRFSSMVFFPRTSGTRLSQIRAIEGNFPFYGELETSPAGVVASFRAAQDLALVDETLMIQYGLVVGDSIRVGLVTYAIAGSLISIPGESLAQSITGPRVFIPGSTLDATGLVQRGSQLYYNQYFKFDDTVDVDALVEQIKPTVEQYRFDVDTVEDRKNSLGRSLTNLTNFLNLVGFVALLLGGLGIASSIHVYIQRKVDTVAVLRCVGVSMKQALGIYVIQSVGMGMIGATVGSLIGIGVQRLVPIVLADFLPIDIAFGISWGAVLSGFVIGMSITALFALQPLVGIRNISPLRAIRRSVDTESMPNRDPYRWAIYFVVAAGILVTALALTDDLRVGFGFFGAVIAAFGLLALIGTGIIRAARKWFPMGASYTVRQGLANLYRPNNQTLVMIITLGFGTFLIATLFLTRDMLLEQIELTSSENQANLVLYDIQTDQKEGIKDILRQNEMPLNQDVPIVTMRMTHINGTTVEEIRDNDSTDVRIPNWLYRRETRATYRAEITEAEKIVDGTYVSYFDDFNGLVPISIEKGVAEDMKLGLGDQITFNVQGVPLESVISSVREVNWQQVQPNFIFSFPDGILNEAPQFHVFVTYAPDRQTGALVQREVISQFGNVSIIDLALILTTVDDILGRVSFVIQFMALFSVITGLIVLSGAVVASRFQRMRESVLLKTLGARSKQVLRIMSVEYAVLGIMSALTGILLSVFGSLALAWFVFDTAFIPDPTTLSIMLLVVVVLTMGIGHLNSRDIYRRSPLDVLRSDS